jgi:hypothetical protein
MSPLPRCWILTALLLVVVHSTADVYRWVDENGNVVFSDTPIEGAEKLELREPTIVPATPVPRRTEKLSPPAATAPAYTTLRIASPADGETVRNVQDIAVSVVIEPALVDGHVVQFLLDGAPHGAPFESTQGVLSGVERGEHQLGAEIRDQAGKTLLRAAPIVIYVHQASLFQPSRAGS